MAASNLPVGRAQVQRFVFDGGDPVAATTFGQVQRAIGLLRQCRRG